MRPIPLPNKKTKIKDNTTCFVAGWGATRSRGRSVDKLREVKVSTIRRAICKEAWKEVDVNLPDNIICAGGYKTKSGSCQVCQLPFYPKVHFSMILWLNYCFFSWWVGPECRTLAAGRCPTHQQHVWCHRIRIRDVGCQEGGLVIPAPLLHPQFLNEDLGSCGVGSNDYQLIGWLGRWSGLELIHHLWKLVWHVLWLVA